MLDKKRNALGPWWQLLPAGGICAYFALYVVAAALYPGGSQADKASVGFSWLHNYWCNLLNADAINGQPNAAQSVALAAMGVLCVSLIVFWCYLPQLFAFSTRGAAIIRATGILSMVSAGFIFTEYHDLVINIAGLLGLIALTGTFVGLYKARLANYFWVGVLCVLLMVVNNYVYYTKHFLCFLPVIQKITLIVVLSWISSLSVKMYRTAKTRKI